MLIEDSCCSLFAASLIVIALFSPEIPVCFIKIRQKTAQQPVASEQILNRRFVVFSSNLVGGKTARKTEFLMGETWSYE
jgi:hypothetical protein